MMKKRGLSINLFVIFAAAVSAVAGAADQIKVGGDQGWRKPDANNTDFYVRWAGSIQFLVGDSLYFKYQNDSVLSVDKRSYYHCITTNPYASFNDGKTVFPLGQAGVLYFISGAPDHCKHGQSLMVSVVSLDPPAEAPSGRRLPRHRSPPPPPHYSPPPPPPPPPYHSPPPTPHQPPPHDPWSLVPSLPPLPSPVDVSSSPSPGSSLGPLKLAFLIVVLAVLPVIGIAPAAY